MVLVLSPMDSSNSWVMLNAQLSYCFHSMTLACPMMDWDLETVSIHLLHIGKPLHMRSAYCIVPTSVNQTQQARRHWTGYTCSG
jgi:hypothetical protein